MKINGAVFDWKDTEKMYMSDAKCYTYNLSVRTDIVKHAIHSDIFTLMNTSYAKEVFWDKTVCEVLLYLSIRLQVKFLSTHLYPSQWHKFMEKWEFLNDSITPNTFPTLKSSLTLLHYQIYIYGIYIERLISRRCKLTKDNIDNEERDMDEIGSFLDVWLNQRSEVKER